MNQLEQLSQKCIHATAGDYRIDEEINRAIGGNIAFCPRYTRSLDDALKLVPEDHDWIVEHVNGGLTIGARVGPGCAAIFGETAPLALCAAALHVRGRMPQ
jgi:hypothetical protein